MLDHQEEGNQKTEIANSVCDEGLHASSGSGVFQEVEADQKIRCQTHALPPNKHDQVVVGQDQHEHEKHEQIQIGEEAPEAVILPHVADRINVDEEADTGYHHQHDERKLI